MYHVYLEKFVDRTFSSGDASLSICIKIWSLPVVITVYQACLSYACPHTCAIQNSSAACCQHKDQEQNLVILNDDLEPSAILTIFSENGCTLH